MTYQQRVDELKALLEGLPGDSVVHNRIRLSTQWDTYLSLFKTPSGLIDGWEISRGQGIPTTPIWRETYVIRRLLGFNDATASDLTFQESLDDAVRLFRGLHATSWGAIPETVRLETIEERMFGSVFCHFAEGTLAIDTEIDLL